MVEFLGLNDVDEDELSFVIVLTKYKDKWVYVKHKKRTTWESPGGRRVKKEDINFTASRELMEETDAKEFYLDPICNISVDYKGEKLKGRLFYAEVYKLGKVLQHEIKEVKLFRDLPEDLTYGELQISLLKRFQQYLKEIDTHQKIV